MNNGVFRRLLLGFLAGAASCWVLASSCDQKNLGVLFGLALGVAFGLALVPAPGAYLEMIMTSATMGVPLWGLISIIVLPLSRREEPLWTAVGMRDQFPELIGWLLYGALVGFLIQAMTDLTDRFLGPVREAAPPVPSVRCRVLILGGGFGGASTAEHLEREFGSDPSVSLTLVSETNAFLFTPMLAEVAGSSLEATHISTPLRTTLKRTQVVRGEVVWIDLEKREVHLAPEAPVSGDAPNAEPPGPGKVLSYDQLVLALGSVSNYLGLENVEQEAFNFKSLADAIAIRNRVIDLFERADREPQAESRKAMLTFVVAGGGFAGAELAGALNDLTRGMLAYYLNLRAEELHVILVHSGQRILPELSEPLAAYALDRMAERGVVFKLNVRVKDARRGAVLLSSDEEIRTETLVWTAGTAPNPLLTHLRCGKDKRGAVIVDETLAVPGHPGVWALGDCASIPDRKGKTCPPTAQFALREARQVARNIRATLEGRAPVPFRFKSLGMLCVVGHHTACAEIRGLRFSGLFAWFLWRFVYLMKLPGLERRVRVVIDWTIDLFFPRDIVQTIDLAPSGSKQQGVADAVEKS